jgi:hypothetical protein
MRCKMSNLVGDPGVRRALVLACAVVVTAAGCAGGRRPVKVEGVVTIEGRPVEGASVVFNPVDTREGVTANGTTGADGSFKLHTQNYGPGALPGEYKVTVQLFGKFEREMPKPENMEAVRYMMKFTPEEKARKFPRLPAVYGDVQKTPLTCRVPPDGKVNLDLKGKVTVK